MVSSRIARFDHSSYQNTSICSGMIIFEENYSYSAFMYVLKKNSWQFHIYFIISYQLSFLKRTIYISSYVNWKWLKWIFWCQSQQVQNSITVFEDIFIWLKKVCIYWKSIYMFLELLEVSHYYIYSNATEKSIYFWEFFKNHISMNFT